MFDEIRKDKALVQVFIYLLLVGVFLIQDRLNPGVYEIYSKADDLIPFVPVFVVVYFLWYVFLAGTGLYFLMNSKRDLYMTFYSINLCMLVAIAVYMVFPSYVSLRPDSYAPDFFSQWVRMLQAFDSPSAVCPSLHAAISLSLFAGVADSKLFKDKQHIKIATFILALLIIASTVLTKQHSVVDVACGLLLGAAVYLFVYKFRFS